MVNKKIIYKVFGLSATFSLAITIVGCITNSVADDALFHCGWQSDKSYQVEQLNSFESLWVTEAYITSNHERASYLAAYEDTLFLYGSTDKCKTEQLLGLNSIDGTVKWSLVDTIPYNLGVENISSNSSYVFIGYDGRGKAVDTSIMDAGGVIAYDISLGQQLWHTPISGTRGMLSLASAEGLVSVDGGLFSKRFYLLNVQDGSVVYSMEKAQVGIPYSAPSVNFAVLLTNLISTNKIHSNLTSIDSWVDIFNETYLPPILIEDFIIMRSNPANQIGKIKVLSLLTGQTLWETEDEVLSNVVVGNSTVFYLTKSEIKAINLISGELIGHVKFSQTGENTNGFQSFYIATNKQNDVFAYLGDSYQLFAFKFIES